MSSVRRIGRPKRLRCFEKPETVQRRIDRERIAAERKAAKRSKS